MAVVGKNSGRSYEDRLLTDFSAPPPNFILQIVMALVAFLHRLIVKLNPPSVTTLNQCISFVPTTWLMMTARLGIPDMLKDGPLTAAEIASRAGGLREDDLYRALRMLSAHGYYEALPGSKSRPTRFRNTATTAVLREDHPNSVKYVAMHWQTDHYIAFDFKPMDWHLRQEGGDEVPCAFEKARGGKNYWEYAKEDPKIEAIFSKGMANVDSLGLEAQLQDYNWGRFKRMVDIAGANGSVLAAVLRRRPQLQGVLFDQPQVIEGAKKIWQDRSDWKAVSDRVEMVGGDLFKPETLPRAKDGDLFFMRSILHDWSDEASIRILKTLRQAIGSAKVTLALCELTLSPEFSTSPLHTIRYSCDMLMHGVVRGKERTQQQWVALFEASGFKLTKLHNTRSPQSITEAVPI